MYTLYCCTISIGLWPQPAASIREMQHYTIGGPNGEVSEQLGPHTAYAAIIFGRNLATAHCILAIWLGDTSMLHASGE